MFKKVLVANRGEVAVRIIRVLREMGIPSVAIYSTADKDSYHTHLADEAICIGPARASDSYNNMVNVISAALLCQCDAIHPGYGFLSEKSDFVELCEDVNIQFIGPQSKIVDLMGHKQHARETMKKAGVPIVPGSEGMVYEYDDAYRICKEIGYPVMLKAADGGGGKGMRRVNSEGDLESAFRQVQAESQSLFNNKDIYIEKMIQSAYHIEVQILADHYGNVIHLGERDCSLQRKHQKMIEMAPAPFLSLKIKEDLYQAAINAGKAIGYRNAGTIEFLVDQEEKFYFMEMNTRLQVEHPVTEMITGIDIVKEQIKIASGKKLSFNQSDIHFNGFAIECRLNSEDPTNDFKPNAGCIEHLILPSGGLGLRLETSIYPQYRVSPFYDSMIAKVIVHQKTKQEAIQMMKRALFEIRIDGIITNIELLESLIEDQALLNNEYDTQWIEKVFIQDWVESQCE